MTIIELGALGEFVGSIACFSHHARQRTALVQIFGAGKQIECLQRKNYEFINHG
jgi:hypothetical protein